MKEISSFLTKKLAYRTADFSLHVVKSEIIFDPLHVL